MKILFKIPVLLFAIMLVFSCSDSKKEEDKAPTVAEILENDLKRVCELECMSYLDDFDISSDEGQEALKEWESIYDKYTSEESEVSDEIKFAWSERADLPCKCDEIKNELNYSKDEIYSSEDEIVETFEEEMVNENKEAICALVEGQLILIDEVIQVASLLKENEENFFLLGGEDSIRSIEQAFEMIENESDKYFEARDGRTAEDVQANFKKMMNCPSFNPEVFESDELYNAMETLCVYFEGPCPL